VRVDVLFGFRGGQDDDRDAAQLRIGLDLAQRLAPVLFGMLRSSRIRPGAGAEPGSA